MREKGFCRSFFLFRLDSLVPRLTDPNNSRFTVYPRARNVRNLPAFKVKSILKGTEVDCKLLFSLLILSQLIISSFF